MPQEAVWIPGHYRGRHGRSIGASKQPGPGPGGDVSQQPDEYQGGPPPGAAEGEPGGGGNFLTARVGPLPGWAWILIIAGVGLATILFMRNRSAAKQQQAQGATAPPTTATTAADNCTDGSGNRVPCSQADYSAQIAALQAEIDNMQGAPSVPGTGTPVPTTTVNPAQGGAQVIQPTAQSGTTVTGTPTQQVAPVSPAPVATG